MSEGRRKERAPRLSRAEAAKLVAEYEASGVSREAFCAQRGIGQTTLGRYFRWRKEAKAGSKAQWVSVQMTAKQRSAMAGDSKVSVALANGRRIEVSRGFDGALLEQLVRLLERA